MVTRKTKKQGHQPGDDIPLATDAKAFKTSKWPKVTVGSHSTRTEYEDGRVDFVTDWEALLRDVREAIASYESRINCNTVVESKVPPKKTPTRKKNEKKVK